MDIAGVIVMLRHPSIIGKQLDQNDVGRSLTCAGTIHRARIELKDNELTCRSTKPFITLHFSTIQQAR